MKTLFKLFIVALFGIEIVSPFLIAYLNQKEKTRKLYSEREARNIILTNTEAVASNVSVKDWMEIDYSDRNYSDSKTFTVLE